MTYLAREKEMLPQEIDEIILEMELLMEFLDEAGDARTVAVCGKPAQMR